MSACPRPKVGDASKALWLKAVSGLKWVGLVDASKQTSKVEISDLECAHKRSRDCMHLPELLSSEGSADE